MGSNCCSLCRWVILITFYKQLKLNLNLTLLKSLYFDDIYFSVNIGYTDRLSPNPWSLSRKVVKIIPHPNYSRITDMNDIALLKLNVYFELTILFFIINQFFTLVTRNIFKIYCSHLFTNYSYCWLYRSNELVNWLGRD